MQNGGTPTGSTISIADLLDLVKDDFADGFSSDVLQNLGIQRPSGQFAAGVKYRISGPPVPSAELRRPLIDSYRAGPPAPPNNEGAQGNRAERQFAAQTAHNSRQCLRGCVAPSGVTASTGLTATMHRRSVPSSGLPQAGGMLPGRD